MRKALCMMGILDDVDMEWLANHGTVKHVRPGEVLIQEGKSIDALFILLDGKLSVSVGTSNATDIATLLSGEIVGEISFVDLRAPSASVTAMLDSEVLAVPRHLLAMKLANDLPFAARFYKAVATFLADRLYVTVGRFGYGSHRQDVDPDEVHDSHMDDIDLAAVRFDKLLRRLRNGDNRAEAMG
jgi:CRP/FNR family cyclic AMP-dependent transcriptional regulator